MTTFNSEYSGQFEHFLFIDPKGNLFVGQKGFVEYCSRKKLDFDKLAKEYISINQSYDEHRRHGLINATAKAKGVFGDDLMLDKMVFCEFYKIPRFDKTLVGQLLLHAKQTQNQRYILEVCNMFADQIRIEAQKYDAICFVPPSTPRAIQFMTLLDQVVNSDIPRIAAYKEFGDIAIQQKTLKSRHDRIENARETIKIKPDQIKSIYRSCLIIDDAIGSGSTLNEIARKLKSLGLKKITGLGIVGNFDGYDVINEV